MRMYWDLLFLQYIFWLYISPIHFKNHWNLFSGMYSLCESAFCSPCCPVISKCYRQSARGNLLENVFGHPNLMVTFLALLCTHSYKKTTGMTLILCAKVPFAALTFQFLPLQGKSKGKSARECLETSNSYNTCSGSVMHLFTSKTTGICYRLFIRFAKVPFCSPHFPVLATIRENLLQGSPGPLGQGS